MAWCLVSCQSETRNIKKKETVNQTTITVSNKRTLTLLGVSRAMRSSTARSAEMTMTRTFTSHASHARSLNLVSPISACFLSVRLKPRLQNRRARMIHGSSVPRSLAGEFCNHGEERHVQRNYDTANCDSEKADHDRLKQSEHVLGSRIDFIFVKVGDLLQHGVHCAGGFTHANHLRNHVGEHTAFLERINDCPALFYSFAHFHQCIF